VAVNRAGANSKRATAIHTDPDAGAASQALARRIRQAAREAIESRGRFLLVASGGNSPRPLFRILSSAPCRDTIDWSRTEFFWSDERCVPPDHPDSNYRMAKDLLLEPLGVASGRVHRIAAELASPEEAARRYEAEILRCFGGDERELFDVMLLGLGEDGHTASLFPFSAALQVTDRAVVANEVPQLNTTRITLTAPRIVRSREIFFLVHGSNKAAGVSAVLRGPDDSMRFPAQLIRPQHGTVEWFIDTAAAATPSG
jgi:6-phosphogluconolactonase